jgi:predicted ester cyclase
LYSVDRDAENGRVAEHWAKRDDVALAHQIGLFE